MPICLDPNETYKIRLKSDDKKGADAPIFFARAATMREHRVMAERMDDTSDLKTIGDVFESRIGILRDWIVNWENMTDPESGAPLPYDPDRFEDILTALEAHELIRKIMANDHLDYDEKKSSE
jgi:hypothetical protein